MGQRAANPRLITIEEAECQELLALAVLADWFLFW